MAHHDHPSPESAAWDTPDYCPFCGDELPDGGPGFYDHVQEQDNATCLERFDAWRENVVDDIGGVDRDGGRDAHHAVRGGDRGASWYTRTEAQRAQLEAGQEVLISEPVDPADPRR